jgi:exopolysaccharide production protein ExoZ
LNKNLLYLQIARGLAALIVVFHHITASEGFYFHVNSIRGLFTAGWNAVDFFFVLSGFIIYYIHEKDLGDKTQLKRYLSKRFVRIYPIYWIIALVSLVLILAGNDVTTKSSLVGISSHPGYILKSFFLIHQNSLPFLVVAWSLCYEVFFYLVFGIAILAGKSALWVAGSIYLLLFGYQLFDPQAYSNSALLSFMAGNFHIEFILGILTAICFRALQRATANHSLSRQVSPVVLVFTGLAMFASAWAFSLNWPAQFGKFTVYSRLLYGLASALIILGIAQFELLSKNRLARFLLLLGDSSYVLYLIHPVVLAILFKIIIRVGIDGSRPWINYLLFPAGAACCISVGFLIHTKLEKPLLQVFNKPMQKRKSAVV